MNMSGGDVRKAVSGFDAPAVEDRLDALLKAYGAFLRGAIRRVCPATFGISVDEIEQDARIRLWHALRRERNIADPASYLYRIAATAAIDAMRRVRARREHPLTIAGSDSAASEDLFVDPPSPARSPEQLAADQQTTGLVQKALARLRVNRRRAVGLHLRGFTSSEIAQLLGWTEPKARNLTHRGLKDLRELLRDEGIALS
jgi:RNA polymerase sigma factor (sigma-70 family)